MESNDKSTVKASSLCFSSKELDVNLITSNILSNPNSLEWEGNAFDVLKHIGIL